MLAPARVVFPRGPALGAALQTALEMFSARMLSLWAPAFSLKFLQA